MVNVTINGITVLATLTGTHTDLDEAFVWETKDTKYGLDVAIASYERPKDIGFQYDRHVFNEDLRKNLEIIDKWVDGHPETTFYLYFPPYSTLYFDSIKRQGQIDAMMFLLYDGEGLAYSRGSVLYGLDEVANLRFSHENPDVQALYREYLGRPLSELAETLLHTEHSGWFMPTYPDYNKR